MIDGPIVTIGEILVEIMATQAGHGFLEPLALTGPYPSGAPAIFIDQVGRLGHPCGIVGAVGADDFGRLNLDRLRRDGVDVSAVAVHADATTGSAFVRYRPDGGRDFVFSLGASSRIARTPEADALLGRAGHLHVMGSALSIPGVAGLIDGAVDAVRRRGGTVSLDPNLRKEMMGGPVAAALRGVLARADTFLPSGEELSLLAGTDDPSEALARLPGVTEVVLKRGSAGATHAGPEGVTDAPGYRVAELDPTGAGDCFGAAYLAARRMGRGVAEALDLANAAGARTVTVRGPMEGASTPAELDAFRRATPRG